MANLFQKRGFWWINYRHKGIRYRVSTGTKNEKIALVKLKEIEVKLFKGIDPLEQRPQTTAANIIELFKRYLAQSKVSKAKSTHKTERVLLKMWQEFFARKRIRNISEISHSVIADFQVETEISPRTFNNALTLLRSVLNTAIDWGIIESNPTRGYKKVKIPKKLRYFRDEELEKLWDTATPRLRSIIALGAYAGLRNGEMINLQWRDIDFRGKRLEVRSDDEATPKGKRPRSVPMHGKLIRALKAYRGKTAEGFVFPRNDGRGPKSGKEGPSREFSKLLKQVGVGGRLHDLRHTFGSRLVKKGVPLPVV
jgi:integrase